MQIAKKFNEKVYNQDKHDEVIKEFPFTVIAEANYPEHDFAIRWCWQQFGPCNGQCNDYSSEYPACPLVLATEEKNRVLHSHIGAWITIWLCKTGYDYGFNEYCFKNETDKKTFIAAVPSFHLGENYA